MMKAAMSFRKLVCILMFGTLVCGSQSLAQDFLPVDPGAWGCGGATTSGASGFSLHGNASNLSRSHFSTFSIGGSYINMSYPADELGYTGYLGSLAFQVAIGTKVGLGLSAYGLFPEDSDSDSNVGGQENTAGAGLGLGIILPFTQDLFSIGFDMQAQSPMEDFEEDFLKLYGGLSLGFEHPIGISAGLNLPGLIDLSGDGTSIPDYDPGYGLALAPPIQGVWPFTLQFDSRDLSRDPFNNTRLTSLGVSISPMQNMHVSMSFYTEKRRSFGDNGFSLGFTFGNSASHALRTAYSNGGYLNRGTYHLIQSSYTGVLDRRNRITVERREFNEEIEAGNYGRARSRIRKSQWALSEQVLTDMRLVADINEIHASGLTRRAAAVANENAELQIEYPSLRKIRSIDTEFSLPISMKNRSIEGAHHELLLEKEKGPYFVDKNLTIMGGTLRIEAGSVIKFAYPDAAIYISPQAKLVVMGQPDDPVVFTSIYDDQSEDTNLDGVSTKGETGDWAGISIVGSPGSLGSHVDTWNIRNLEIRYSRTNAEMVSLLREMHEVTFTD